MTAKDYKMPGFTFLHAGSDKPFAWPRYKLKECWTLALCLLKLSKVDGPVIVHNWWNDGALKFTHEFKERRAAQVDPRLTDAPIIRPHGATTFTRALALAPALLLALLPMRTLLALVRMCMRDSIGPLVVYCDGHLSGFLLVLAARAKGATTLTLHHGLYRPDDKGSVMGIRNFVSDYICLWDGHTKRSFEEVGVDADRLLQVGEYGFGNLKANGETKKKLAMLCPPYDVRQIGLFRHVETLLQGDFQTKWSLHPMLRADHPDLSQAKVAAIDPRPAVAICGDSGVVMDALARGIPIITVSDRPLATTHLTPKAATGVDAATIGTLIRQAHENLANDQRAFGFVQKSGGAER